MSKDRTIVNPDEYTACRGIPVENWFIKAKETEFAAKLVPDSDPGLQETLDYMLKKFRLEAISLGKSLHPKNYMFTGTEGFFFYSEIPIPAGIYLNGLPSFMTNYIHKPMWFYRPRGYKGAKLPSEPKPTIW